MRLNSILIKNLTSFVGEHVLNFDVFKEDPLFALTGPTGSGKSSILAALGLALYGNHYRSNIHQADLVSVGQKDSKVEVNFSHKGNTYQAIWKCQVLANNGTPLLRPKIERVLLENSHATNKTIEEILHLTFTEFCQVVVLHQGDFVQFLSAPFSERRALLEKLGAPPELQFLSKILRDEIKTLKDEIDQLNSKIEMLTSPIDNQEPLALEQDFGKEEIQLEKEKSRLEFCLEFIMNLEKLGSLNEQIQKLTAELKEQQKLKNDLIPVLSKYQGTYQKQLIELEVMKETFEKENTKLQEAIKLEHEENLLKIKLFAEEKSIQDDLNKLGQYKVGSAKLEQEIDLIKQNYQNQFSQLNSQNEVDIDQKSFIEKNQTTLKEEWKDTYQKIQTIALQKKQLEETISELKHHEKVKEELKQQIGMAKNQGIEFENLVMEKESQLKICEEKIHELKLENMVFDLKVVAKEKGECPVCQSIYLSSEDENKQFKNEASKKIENLQDERVEIKKQQEELEVKRLEWLRKYQEQEIKINQLEIQMQEKLNTLAKQLIKEESGQDDLSTDRQELEKFINLNQKKGIELQEKFILIEKNQANLEKLNILSQDKEKVSYNLGLEQIKIKELEALIESKQKQRQTHLEHYANLKQMRLNNFPEITPQEKWTKLNNELKSFNLELNRVQESLNQFKLEEDRIKQKIVLIQEQLEELSKSATLIFENIPIQTQAIFNLQLPELEFIKEINFFSEHSMGLNEEMGKIKSEMEEWSKKEAESLKTKEKNLIEAKIKKQESDLRKKASDEILRRVELKQNELKKKEKLFLYLGGEDFRNFCLGLIEDRLLKFANQELKELCGGRFELVHSKNKKRELKEFYVIDLVLGQMRKASTLSGGETFLTSLALSLGLSSMVKAQVEIDCFFIDEGFGQLDPNSLLEAVSILDKLRARGKQVGVVSHITELTQNFSNKIIVNKKSIGQSEILIQN